MFQPQKHGQDEQRIKQLIAWVMDNIDVLLRLENVIITCVFGAGNTSPH
jgi:hypothetical protein